MTQGQLAPPRDAQSVGRYFLDRIGKGQLEAAFACLADDVVMEMPFTPPGSPTRLEGAGALRSLYTGVVGAALSVELPVSATRPFADPEWALVEYSGRIVQPGGQEYTNVYHGLFRVVDGRIKLFRELYDTYRFAEQVPPEARRAMFPTTDEG
ncbi:nuclear transport factor 2 family protein [Streptomyces sp. ICN988]|uniref:nuclear transport factor 2 family protein n=1 Tax=Streptomyces sp. ICN988 TaxID=2983765 RepID=UPI0021E39902|nr:nuclear transport factor 2 family protein [Streptomyces sp. ICN988]MCV2459481.1 nuclear transport factor 2 family protein [Streptomyces sp. ICN988]